jgi:hypothetical protein
MARVKIDWAVLRRALGTFGICLLVSGLLLAASFYFRDEMRSVYRDHQARFQTVSRKYLMVDEEERVIERNYPDFIHLYEKGILGDEHRLNWLETLRAAGERVKLPELVYQIDSQEPLTPEFDIATGAYQIFSSNMELRLGLLHEYDMINVFKLLDNQAEGLYSVRSCQIRKTREQVLISKTATNLSADCDLTWYTIDLRSGKLVMDQKDDEV